MPATRHPIADPRALARIFERWVGVEGQLALRGRSCAGRIVSTAGSALQFATSCPCETKLCSGILEFEAQRAEQSLSVTGWGLQAADALTLTRVGSVMLSNQRRHHRTLRPILQARLRWGQQWRSLQVVDLSLGGLGARLGAVRPLPPLGEALELELRSTAGTTISTECVVRSVTHTPGLAPRLGLQFGREDREFRQFLVEVLWSERFSSH